MCLTCLLHIHVLGFEPCDDRLWIDCFLLDYFFGV